MSPHQADAARALSPGAIALMLLLCLSWGFNQVAVKLALPDIPPMLQAVIRSSGAILVLLVIARLRGVKMFERDGTLVPGLVAGVIFGVEFILIYRGLLLTSASRAVGRGKRRPLVRRRGPRYAPATSVGSPGPAGSSRLPPRSPRGEHRGV